MFHEDRAACRQQELLFDFAEATSKTACMAFTFSFIQLGVMSLCKARAFLKAPSPSKARRCPNQMRFTSKIVGLKGGFSACEVVELSSDLERNWGGMEIAKYACHWVVADLVENATWPREA